MVHGVVGRARPTTPELAIDTYQVFRGVDTSAGIALNGEAKVAFITNATIVCSIFFHLLVPGGR